ncbi:MAG TPA: hypothetical protein VMD09_10550 [Solirubrobacteraceae bacterium]|nr:hypothetical protein [Solirubrobacteraceae bacterium]
MGLLDEAIREHLDLKRRSGADPSEVDRLEREALGPVRRSPQDSADPLLDPESSAATDYPAEEEAPYPHGEEAPEWDEAYADPAPFDHAMEPSAAPPAEDWSEPPTEVGHLPSDEEVAPAPDSPRHHEIAEEWEAHERGLAAEPAGYEPNEPAPAPPAPTPDPYPAAPPGEATDHPVFEGERQRPLPPERDDFDQETAEYQVEEAEAEEAEPAEGEDVLEETPDFLQDTPDHDRLWFEQRPPRDFDFDG